ncbi:MAG TPA: hypothetical protein VGC12_00820 [Methyloradius sp.]
MRNACIVFLLLVTLQGCNFYVDNRSNISQALLYSKDGNLNEKALNALLLTRFPIGSQSDDLIAFALPLNGLCAQAPEGIDCLIVETDFFCTQKSIDIEIKTSPSGLITALTTKKINGRNSFC